MSRLRRSLSAFGRFWWEFLVGDTPELVVVVLVVVGAAFALRSEPAAAIPVVIALVVSSLVLSTWRGRKLH